MEEKTNLTYCFRIIKLRPWNCQPNEILIPKLMNDSIDILRQNSFKDIGRRLRSHPSAHRTADPRIETLPKQNINVHKKQG